HGQDYRVQLKGSATVCIKGAGVDCLKTCPNASADERAANAGIIVCSNDKEPLSLKIMTLASPRQIAYFDISRTLVITGGGNPQSGEFKYQVHSWMQAISADPVRDRERPDGDRDRTRGWERDRTERRDGEEQRDVAA